MNNYLQDKDFLKQLDYNREKEVYVRITALSIDEQPVEEIIGKATGGSVNVDGASAVRRTCSLSLTVLDEDTILTDTYWCYKNKFKLEIGLKNNINPEYPDIIWFEMGIYVITSFSSSKNLTSLSISISGKDKMCLLDGSISGTIMYGTDFGNIDEVNKIVAEDGTTEYQTLKTPLTIKEIIYNAVKEYGQEKDYNIIINDLDQHGYELWEYYGDKPIYMFIKNDEGNKKVINITLDEDTEVTIEDEEENQETKIKINKIQQYYSLNTLDPNYNDTATKIKEYSDNQQTPEKWNCYVAKIEYGDAMGYHQIPLIYNSDLILNAGENVVSLLNKLKTMLGDFEFFYDLKGRFVFQKKNTYVQELFSPINGEINLPTMYASKYSYKFEDEALFTTISDTPNIAELKNDFAVWGTKKGATGNDLPLHFRCAIDKKPEKYVVPYDRYEQVPNLIFLETEQLNGIDTKEKYDNAKKQYKKIYEQGDGDWFSLVLSKDYNSEYSYSYFRIIKETLIPDTSWDDDDWGTIKKHYLYQKDGSSYRITQEMHNRNQSDYYNKNNEPITINETSLPYYWKPPINKDTILTTSNYDWRELIYQMSIDYLAHNQDSDFLLKLQEANPQFMEGKTGYEQYYTDLQGFWRELYNPLITEQDKLYAEVNDYEYYSSDDKKHKPYWNKLIHQDPTKFNFWFDFLDLNGELGEYSIKKFVENKYITHIGTRSKVVNDSQVTSIYYNDIPETLIVVKPKEEDPSRERHSYTLIQIQESLEPMFYRLQQGNSAIARMNELIYQNTAIVNSLSITSIPIYYLEPNTRIYIAGKGDYTLDKISYQLSFGGTMQISGNKIIKQYY